MPWHRYWPTLLLGAGVLLIMAVLTLWVLRLNRRLKRAKARLEQRQELILNSVAEGIYGVDLKGCTTFVECRPWNVSPAGGPTSSSARTSTSCCTTPARTGARTRPQECPVYATFRDSVPRYVDDDVFWRKDGRSFPVEYSSTPIRDERGATIGSVVVFRDMTERKQAAEKIRRHQAELAHVARLSTLGEMASGIAHELNQPLTAISANARACVRMVEGGRATHRALQRRDGAHRGPGRAGRGGHPPHPPLRAQGAARRLAPRRSRRCSRPSLALLRPDAQRAGVVLETQVGEGAEWVLAQEIQIEQVVLNLARNAIEAMARHASEPAEPGASRRLSLSAEASPGGVEIAVADTGPGLAPEVAETRLPALRDHQAPGTGAWAVHQRRDLRGPRRPARCRFGPGPGAVFRFTLPGPCRWDAVIVPRGDPGPAPASPVPTRFRTSWILNPPSSSSTTTRASGRPSPCSWNPSDWRPEGYPSAQAYLDAFDPASPGCLVLDVRMRGMSGLELQQRLAAEPLHPPIVIITGHGDVPMAVRAVQAGAVDFIEKPFNDQVLLDAVHRALHRDAQVRGQAMRLADIQERLQRLTPREREILDLIVAGRRNKVIAADLGISQSTVEAHRAKVMEKLEARSLSDLMRMVLLTSAG